MEAREGKEEGGRRATTREEGRQCVRDRERRVKRRKERISRREGIHVQLNKQRLAVCLSFPVFFLGSRVCLAPEALVPFTRVRSSGSRRREDRKETKDAEDGKRGRENGDQSESRFGWKSIFFAREREGERSSANASCALSSSLRISNSLSLSMIPSTKGTADKLPDTRIGSERHAGARDARGSDDSSHLFPGSPVKRVNRTDGRLKASE